MRLKTYLHQISPILSTPDAARRLLRIFALVLLIGILGGVYSFLLFTFNNEVSQRRSAMSGAIAEAHTFFTTREALLKSLSLAATQAPRGIGSRLDRRGPPVARPHTRQAVEHLVDPAHA